MNFVGCIFIFFRIVDLKQQCPRDIFFFFFWNLGTAKVKASSQQTRETEACMNNFVLFCCFFPVLFFFFRTIVWLHLMMRFVFHFSVMYYLKNEQECITRFKNWSNLAPRSLVDEDLVKSDFYTWSPVRNLIGDERAHARNKSSNLDVLSNKKVFSHKTWLYAYIQEHPTGHFEKKT